MGQDDDMLSESFSTRKKCFTAFQRITVISNILFGLFAVLLVALGALGLKTLKAYDSFYKTTIPAGLLVLGVILLGIIAIGLAGSWAKSTKLLMLYFILLLIIIICEFGVGGGAYTLRGRIPDTLDASWMTLSDSDRNSFQVAYNCCGWAYPWDHEGSNCANVSNPNATIPLGGRSIEEEEYYLRDATQIGNTTMVNSNVGCEGQLVSYYQNELYVIGTVGVVFATLQLLALISSLVVFVFIKVEQVRSKEERF